ncbi:MAG: hypothetical protein A2X25_15495 [Chloroflexi bacterium GWB2_49_20]|nr:MAG: hypothetical protein A2X25_15495 [Chloroflexi bacterium GWB2_49_20]OGN77471.1 MAG: hypothetical protein A2X26_13725 [Chloroflexi bacterium GWC2_49_37]OGN84825.1 MAG: hypothetical protein A2X27_14725 [Chloroflexi bacterium GWD2_49_16]HCC79252.1 hypothetical protein [Anaerolineae bacterium]
MTHLIYRSWTKVLLMLILLFAASACLTLTDSSPSQTQAPEVTGGSSAVSQDPDVIIVEGDVAFGPGSFDLTEPAVGLSDLSSYKATLIISFDGTRDGQPEQWSRTYVMLANLEPTSRQLTIEKAGDISDLHPVFMAEVDGAAYERRGENACAASVIQEGISLAERWEPAGFLIGIIGAEAAGSETVNGVAADHYTFDERALGLLGIAQSTGELWVASDGSYIVKYVLTTAGNADYFGEGIEGSLTLNYELTSGNQPVTFELPGDCPAGMVNAPQLSDASNIQNMPGLLTYDTFSSLPDAAAFYQKQIPDLGWTLLGEPVITESTVLMDYTQGVQKITVIITTGDAGTKVHIILGKSQE